MLFLISFVRNIPVNVMISLAAVANLLLFHRERNGNVVSYLLLLCNQPDFLVHAHIESEVRILKAPVAINFV